MGRPLRTSSSLIQTSPTGSLCASNCAQSRNLNKEEASARSGVLRHINKHIYVYVFCIDFTEIKCSSELQASICEVVVRLHSFLTSAMV